MTLPGPGWTRERVAELRRLIAAKHSASQIAAIFGGVSRNAVVGKAHRLDLTIDGDPFDHRRRFSRKRDPNKVKVPHKAPWAPVAKHAPREPLPAITRRAPLVFRAPQPPSEPVSRNLPLTEWTATTCKWIAGEGPAGLACGHPTYQGSPWCEHHARRAYA